MHLSVYRALLWLVVWSCPCFAFATHQVGGQLEMRAVGDRPGHYVVTVTNYLEDNNRGASQQGGFVAIYRKRDNALMRTFPIFESSQRTLMIFTNEACVASSRNQRVLVATFEADLQLDPAEYADAQGYYMSYQTQNRNDGINNIVNPVRTGFTFYLEFPPLQQGGQLFVNSSPHFGPINGEYICIGDAFTFPFGATDTDGDELRYALVTPLDKSAGFSNRTSYSPGPYPEVSWLSGFSATNAIPGSPTLTINPQTGLLSLTATQLGLFVFAVKVEEYRNGRKIGEVRRDFQFLVIDCPPLTVPKPTISERSHPAGQTEFSVCRGTTLVLQTQFDSTWNYQWRREGVNIAGATSTELTVSDAGEYSVFVSLKTKCGKASGSQSIKVTIVDLEARSLTTTGQLCATDGSVQLTVPGGSELSYQWFRDGQLLAGQTGNTVTTSQPGQYGVTLRHNQLGCTGKTPFASVVRAPVVVATIQASQHKLCPAATLPLNAGGGSTYNWQKDGQPLTSATGATHGAQSAGSYVVTAIADNGCRGVSAPFVVEAIPGIQVSMSSVPAVCGNNGMLLTLTGSPAGGTFAGPGVSGDQFNPQAAGFGDHTLTYTVVFAPECPGAVTQQTAVVAPYPTVQFPEEIITAQGNSLTLTPTLTGNPVLFAWSPPTDLASTTEASARIVNIQDDRTYTLQVENQAGCRADATVTITVYERIWVPSAFTPNGDGRNDHWELKGVEAFPQVEVTVFNRWGEVVYWSADGYAHPFDGSSKGKALPTGVYAYALRYDPDKPLLRGTVTILP